MSKNITNKDRYKVSIRNVAIGIGIGLLFITVMIIMAVVYMRADDKSRGDQSISTVEGGLNDSSTEMTEYVSMTDGFRIYFPGNPDVNRSVVDVNGINVPATLYGKQSKNGAGAYYFTIHDLSGIEVEPTSTLERVMNSAIQSVEGTISQSEFSTFAGLESIEAIYNAPFNGKVAEGYAVIFIKDSKMYGLITIGVPKDEFISFASSLQFD